MPKVFEEATGRTYDLPTDQATQLVKGSKPGAVYRFADGEKLHVEGDIGVGTEVSPEDYDRVVAGGSRPETAEDQFRAEDKSRKHDEHGGLGGQALTAVEHVGDTLSMGLLGAGARAFASDEYNKNRRERTEENPGTALTSDLGALAVGGIGAAGKGALGRAARLTPYGKTVAMSDKAVKGGKVLRGLAAEGAVQNMAMELQAITLSEDPLTIERVAAQMGTGALTGGGVGFGLGVLGKAMTKGALKTGKLLSGESKALGAEARAGRELLEAEAGIASREVLGAEAKGAKAASKGRGAVTDASEEALGLAEDLKAHRNTDVDVIGVFYGPNKAVLAKQRGSKGFMDKLLDDAVGLSENPRRALTPLRREAQILEEGIADTEKLMRAGASHDSRMLAQANKLPLGGKLTGQLANAYGDFAKKKFTRAATKKGIAVSAKNFDEFKMALEDGTMAARRADTIKQLPRILEDNKAMQQKVLDIVAAGKTGKDGFVKTAVLGAAFTAGTGAANAMLPDQAGFVAPLIGAGIAGKVNGLIFGRMGKVAKAASQRSSRAVEMFLKAGEAGKRLAVPAATKVLTEARFGQPDPVFGGAPEPKRHKDKLVAAFRDREKEIYGQVMMGPNGLPVMRPEARKKIYDNLSGVRALSPQLADNIESLHARKVEFIAAKLPKRPDSAAPRSGPDTWRPSDMSMRELARYVAAVEDPQGVLERLSDGTVTPEDGEAIREVYPQEFQDFQGKVIAELPKLREKLDYRKRLALSIFTGVPVDASMDPRVLGILQGNYAQERGAGNEAPRANPQFGSVSKPEPTPGQKRAG